MKSSKNSRAWSGYQCPLQTSSNDDGIYALGWKIEDFPNSYDYYHNLITLPLQTKLSDEDVDYVCTCLREVFKEEC
jgi:dTDP-4-amino-4,6-dideoxygalactose transaminase